MLRSSLAFVLLLSAASPRLGLAQGSERPGSAVCSASGLQSSSFVIPDGFGGTILAWEDERSGSPDRVVYAQRIDSQGSPVWEINGRQVSRSGFADSIRALLPAPSGGSIVVWREDFSPPVLRAQRLDGSGDPLWPVGGIALSGLGGAGLVTPALIADGAGGFFAAWSQQVGIDPGVLVQRFDSSGNALWGSGGVTVVNVNGAQVRPLLALDGAGGIIVAWLDNRTSEQILYAQRVNSAGTPLWPVNGSKISNRAGDVIDHRIVALPGGESIMVWSHDNDGASLADDIYAQRVNGSGLNQWGASGVVVCNAAGRQDLPQIRANSDGGATITWEDDRSGQRALFAQRLTNTGAIAGGWPGNGVALNTPEEFPESPHAFVGDGAGGGIVAWGDARAMNLDRDLYAQRLDGLGNRTWGAADVLVCGSEGAQSNPKAIGDGAGGVFIAWEDSRRGEVDLYLHRVGPTGSLLLRDRDAPHELAIRDVSNDQGGSVFLTWSGSALDNAESSAPITGYRIWRRVPNAVLEQHPETQRTGNLRDVPVAAPYRALAIPGEIDLTYWEALATLPSEELPGYGYVAATTQDSIGGSNPKTAFFVTALTADPDVFYESLMDSGYSVDNLQPATPMMFTGSMLPGATALHWEPSPEPDFAEYRLYRGSTPDFVPGPEHLISTQADTGYVDPSEGPFTYKLSAVDNHGNESTYASFSNAGTTDAGIPGASLMLSGPHPNPSMSRAILRFAVGTRTEAVLSVHDVSGRLVRKLLHGWLEPGTHAAEWDGRTENELPAPAGVYLYRLVANGQVRATKGVLAR